MVGHRRLSGEEVFILSLYHMAQSFRSEIHSLLAAFGGEKRKKELSGDYLPPRQGPPETPPGAAPLDAAFKRLLRAKSTGLLITWRQALVRRGMVP